MTKVFIWVGGGLLLAIIASYLLIPSRIKFSKVIYLNVPEGSAERAFYSSSERLKWWPNQAKQRPKSGRDQGHTFGNYTYVFPPTTYSGSSVGIHEGEQKFNSSLHFVSFRIDSVGIKWQSELPATNNPFKRVSNYLGALDIKQNMAQILDTFKVFLDKPENLYGLKIVQEKVTDTLLISLRWTSSTYPSTETIYEKIDALKSYIVTNKGVDTNHPMLHIFKDKGEYKNMVAIPVNKELPETGSFILKRMVAGKILTTVVRGGMRSPASAMNKIEQYIDDHKLTSPAIPFESLVTNRMLERDTSMWVTKVYYPIY